MKTEQTINNSLIIPVYKNEENIPDLLHALEVMWKNLGNDLEVIFVVDGSPDGSFSKLDSALSAMPYNAQLIAHSRNFGAFTAIRTGMEYANGDYVAVMAADLQEPTELIEQFFSVLNKNEADIVFGKRTGRNDPPVRKFLANSYWKLYRKFILPDIPEGGVDVFACNRKVLGTLLSIYEPNSSLISQLFWVGYRRSFISYERLERQHGESSWGMRKRFRYMLDSIFSYSDLPIMTVLWLGAVGCIVTFIIGLATIIGKILGWIEVPGYTTLTLVILFFSSTLMLTQGIIGCYLWRAFENTKRRPINIVSNVIKNTAPSENIQSEEIKHG